MKSRSRFFLKASVISISLYFIMVWLSIFGFNSPFGTPYGWIISKYKIETYSKSRYGKEVETGSLQFNFKNNNYTCQLKTEGNVYFTTVSYDTSTDTIIDQLYLEQASTKANLDLSHRIKTIDTQLGEDIHLPAPMAFCAIDGKQDFSNTPLKRKDKIYLLGIKNTDVTLTLDQSKEKMLEIVSFIFAKLGDDNYNFTSSQIIYIDINGVKQLEISAEDSGLPYSELIPKIEELERGIVEDKIITQLEAVRAGKLSKEEIILDPLPE